MSRSRQPDGPQVRLSSVAWAAAYTWRDRVSEWGQIVFASRGTLTVHTDEGLWVVPVHQAVWVPAGVRHAVEVAGGVALRSLHIHPAVRVPLPGTCRVVEISPLLREILRRAMRLRTLDRRIAAERHLLDVLLDELTVLPLTPLDLPLPRDPRAVRAAAYIRGEPAARHTLAE
ncbi:MAG TPA: AraC family ligand binding domain-containing protein, partial [Thermoanaerobaculia bacterium]